MFLLAGGIATHCSPLRKQFSSIKQASSLRSSFYLRYFWVLPKKVIFRKLLNFRDFFLRQSFLIQRKHFMHEVFCILFIIYTLFLMFHVVGSTSAVYLEWIPPHTPLSSWELLYPRALLIAPSFKESNKLYYRDENVGFVLVFKIPPGHSDTAGHLRTCFRDS